LPEKLAKYRNFFKIFLRKIIKLPEFYMILPENARILHNNCPKNIFSRILGGTCPPPCPTPMIKPQWDLFACVIVEFDSWYEESFLGGVSSGEAPPAGSTTNVPPGKPESLTKADTCVRHASLIITIQCYIVNDNNVSFPCMSRVPTPLEKSWKVVDFFL